MEMSCWVNMADKKCSESQDPITVKVPGTWDATLVKKKLSLNPGQQMDLPEANICQLELPSAVGNPRNKCCGTPGGEFYILRHSGWSPDTSFWTVSNAKPQTFAVLGKAKTTVSDTDRTGASAAPLDPCRVGSIWEDQLGQIGLVVPRRRAA